MFCYFFRYPFVTFIRQLAKHYGGGIRPGFRLHKSGVGFPHIRLAIHIRGAEAVAVPKGDKGKKDQNDGEDSDRRHKTLAPVESILFMEYDLLVWEF